MRRTQLSGLFSNLIAVKLLQIAFAPQRKVILKTVKPAVGAVSAEPTKAPEANSAAGVSKNKRKTADETAAQLTKKSKTTKKK